MSCACQKSKRAIAKQGELPLPAAAGRKVYTYYEPTGVGESSLLSLWAKSWRLQGWTPVVLSAQTIKAHPLMLSILHRFYDELPTVNDPAYELQCYYRWLAYDIRSPGVFTDYDMINYSLKPEDCPAMPEGKEPGLMALNKTGAPDPGLFVANQLGIRKMLHSFLHGTPPKCIVRGAHGAREHVSDMYFFHDAAAKHDRDLSVVVGQPGWEKSPCVHFAQSHIRNLRPGVRRSVAIPSLRNL